MGTARWFKRSKPRRRPKKTGAALRRRQNVHMNRLAAYGLSEQLIAAMTPRQRRAKLAELAGVSTKKL